LYRYLPKDQKTKRPKDQKTKRPKDQKTKRPKDQKTKRPKEGVDSIYDKVNIITKHEQMITMCGDIQSKFRHGIESTQTDVLLRISLSFRQY
jgi:hypothetical protein